MYGNWQIFYFQQRPRNTSDISVLKVISVTVNIQFGTDNLSSNSVSVHKKTIISVQVQFQFLRKAIYSVQVQFIFDTPNINSNSVALSSINFFDFLTSRAVNNPRALLRPEVNNV